MSSTSGCGTKDVDARDEPTHDHLVGTAEQRDREGETERLGVGTKSPELLFSTCTSGYTGCRHWSGERAVGLVRPAS
jgi:hypothetical protein